MPDLRFSKRSAPITLKMEALHSSKTRVTTGHSTRQNVREYFKVLNGILLFNPYPTAFPYGNVMVLHFYQQQESSTTKTVHKVINKRLKAYV